MKGYQAGLDIGSTTIKMVVMKGEAVVLKRYARHCADVEGILKEYLQDILQLEGAGEEISLNITGSVGMGLAETFDLPFVQEVVAATHYIQCRKLPIATMIDIGGEDAKVVFWEQGQVQDLRMNGNCAGGTGAFIDQMAILLGVGVDELGALAERAARIHPIASRCGVFCKTDIQNLMARGAAREDIAASIFHAVALQTVTTLAHGHRIQAPVLLCGGPLCYLPALRQAFAQCLDMEPERDFILPEDNHLIPAMGAALSTCPRPTRLRRLLAQLEQRGGLGVQGGSLPVLFANQQDYDAWRQQHNSWCLPRAAWRPGKQEAYLGIDSGSTTTKLVLLSPEGELLHSFYRYNNGDPLGAVAEGLDELHQLCHEHGTELDLCGSCSTGYGEELLKAAFHLDTGIIETMAHYTAARHLMPEVSFILDIGGQDMKAIFVHQGAITRIDINEACSSGCGSFISTFAQSLGQDLPAFTQAACFASKPCDLGTRCTVFMNSRIKQVLRQGASQADIAAGLSYSVVKNCLYKVLRLNGPEALGKHIIVQGGTMRNDAIVRSFERLTGVQAMRSDCPELMGALGCALYARQLHSGSHATLAEIRSRAQGSARLLHCRGCENQCEVTCHNFGSGRRYFSGNRCENVFSNGGSRTGKGRNIYAAKRELLFNRPAPTTGGGLRIGIPRCLNMYEEYPFWHTLLAHCGLEPVLSAPSSQALYEQGLGHVMSDNICMPAKMVHGHILHLQKQGVSRIFMPFVLFEKGCPGQPNSYNCPIVTGYSSVIQSVQGELPIDSPAISFRDPALLRRQCRDYLTGLGIPAHTADQAFRAAWQEQERFENAIAQANATLLAEAREEGQPVILLAGRPYHSDPFIQHKIAEMIAAMGITVISDDIVRGMNLPLPKEDYLPQWAYPNRMLQAAQWAGSQAKDVQFVQLTSFGCGPDALLADAINGILRQSGRNMALLKIDDVCNMGSIRLRIRSLVESLRTNPGSKQQQAKRASLPVYTRQERQRTILAPFLSEFISPLLPALMERQGYKMEVLPPSDQKSVEWGLQYSNNEICYPATLIVGDIIKAFRSGSHEPAASSIIITQTGGQCRASNYLPLIRKALLGAGYANVPLLSLSWGSSLGNHQPGFRPNWLKLAPQALDAILFSDCLSRLYHAAAVREQHPGQAATLRERFLSQAQEALRQGHSEGLYPLISEAATLFQSICRTRTLPRVGMVGEIFLKFHPFAQKNVTSWLMERGIEVIPPLLTPFFTQLFINHRVRRHSHITRPLIPQWMMDRLQRLVQRKVDEANQRASAFPYYTPIEAIHTLAQHGEQAINLNAQFGEGWLIPAEILSYAKLGITHVISLQPFGCIANHIVQKGIENKLRRLAPELSLLSLDFDSSVSDVNIANRLLLFLDNLTPSEP